MNTYIHIVSWIGFILFIFTLIVEPALFGTERKPYSFGGWLFRVVLSVLITFPIYFRVLGFI